MREREKASRRASRKKTAGGLDSSATRARIITKLRLCPVFGNAGTARTFTDGAIAASDLIDAVAVLAEAAERVKAGNLSEMESS
jgi:hypothetical protein